ncbi:MAG: hypothetical protein QM718_05860 [Steroidobacteraceae bacterium]
MQTERGTILVITLILAGLLAVLAVGAMQSAAFELTAAAQEQARTHALRAAENGLALLAAQLLAQPDVTTAGVGEADCVASAGAHCSATLQWVMVDAIEARQSAGARVASHYTARSEGSAGRGARVRLECGWRLVTVVTTGAQQLQLIYWKRSDAD